MRLRGGAVDTMITRLHGPSVMANLTLEQVSYPDAHLPCSWVLLLLVLVHPTPVNLSLCRGSCPPTTYLLSDLRQQYLTITRYCIFKLKLQKGIHGRSTRHKRKNNLLLYI